MERDKPSLASGLDAILKLRERSIDIHAVTDESEKLCRVAIEKLVPGEFQPRKKFTPADLQDLAKSIQSQGILQPIIVRRQGEQFEIVAGERRWQAAKLVGFKEVPVIIREIPDAVAAAFSLVENIQRKDLNPLEEATALYRLYHEFHLSHEQIAHSVGRSRVAVTNIMRLLSLHEKVKHYLLEDALTMGHARALISLERHEQERICDLILKKGLSVRQTEELVRHTQADAIAAVIRLPLIKDPQLQQWQQELTDFLQFDLTIKEVPQGKYHITLQANSKSMLAELIKRLKQSN